MDITIECGRSTYGLARRVSITLIVGGVVAILVYAWTRIDEQLYQVTQQSYLPAVSPAALPAAGVQSTDATIPAKSVLFEAVPIIPMALKSQRLRRWTSPDPKVVGKLVIPKLGIDVVVREGTDDPTLRRAVGHIPNTALPGQTGNFVVTGHRDTFFRPLRNIHANDLIHAVTAGFIYTYLVYDVSVVAPNYMQALRPTSQPECTLITCFPFEYVGSAPRRFIVHARLVESRQLPGS